MLYNYARNSKAVAQKYYYLNIYLITYIVIQIRMGEQFKPFVYLFVMPVILHKKGENEVEIT